jgi:NAD(P)-dependent dehydrogenase (short-subunit alcohol dehydrogenase family)
MPLTYASPVAILAGEGGLVRMLNLEGRGAIVTGARRVGAVVVRRLAAEGINVAIVYRRSRDEAQELLNEILPMSPLSCLVQADLSIEADVKRVMSEAKTQLGDLSFCINMASDYPRVPFDELDGAAWDHGMELAKANYLVALHAARVMAANEPPTRGHLVFFGDWAAGETPYRDFLPYLTAKAAVHFMTRAFGLELAEEGILVNAIAPGPTARLPGVVSSEEWDVAMALTPLHRESSPEDMAELIVTLLRLETITGETIRVDSGRHIAGS